MRGRDSEMTLLDEIEEHIHNGFAHADSARAELQLAATKMESLRRASNAKKPPVRIQRAVERQREEQQA